MKKTKHYKSLHDLSIKNWYQLQNSISKNEPNFNFLVKSGKLDKKKGAKIYEKLIFELPKIDCLDFLLKTKLEILLQQFQITIKLNKDIRPIIQEANKILSEYINSLSEKFDSFIYNKFSLKSDYKEIYAKIYNSKIPTSLNDIFKNGIVLFDVLLFENIDKYYKNIYLSELMKNKILFIGLFFDIKEARINNIYDFLDPIKKMLFSAEQFNEYYLIRLKLIDNLKKQKIEDTDNDNYSLSELSKLFLKIEMNYKVKLDFSDDTFKVLSYFEELKNIK